MAGPPINLIRDRAQFPPTRAARLSVLHVTLLGAAYVGTLVLVLVVYLQLRDAQSGLQTRLDDVRQLRKEVQTKTVQGGRAYEAGIEDLRRIIRLDEQKKSWSKKLFALQRQIAPGTALLTVEGKIEDKFTIEGYSRDSDNRGMERVARFVSNLQQSEPFMKGISELSVGGITRKNEENDQNGKKLYFTLHCKWE